MLNDIYRENYEHFLTMLSSNSTGFVHVFEVQPDFEQHSPSYVTRFLHEGEFWDYRFLPCGIGYYSLATDEDITVVTRQVVYFRKPDEIEDDMDVGIYRPNGRETRLWNTRVLKSLHITNVHIGQGPDIGGMTRDVDRMIPVDDMVIPQAYVILNANKGCVSGRDIWDPTVPYEAVPIGAVSFTDKKDEAVWNSSVDYFPFIAESRIERN